MHHRMRMKAVHVLGFPFYKQIAPFVGYIKELLQLDPLFRVITPDKVRTKIWHWIYGTSFPGRQTHAINKSDFQE